MNLENTKNTPTILITGASSGIGKAWAETFAAKGWNVCATMPDIPDDESLKRIPNVGLREERNRKRRCAYNKYYASCFY